MLQKNIDHIVYGLNYYSYFLGINQLRKGQSTLLVDDERTNFGPFYLQFCSQMERSLFLRMGEIYQIPAFTQIDSYLQMSPFFYQLGSSVIRLGDTPYRNLCELSRRFFFAFGKQEEDLISWLERHQLDCESFNSQFSGFLDSLAGQVVGVKNNHSIDFSLFYHLAPAFLRELYDLLSSFFYTSDDTSAESWSLKSLLSAVRAMSQEKLSLKFGKFELFHLLIVMLSTHYEIKRTDFLKSLDDTFNALGGKVRHVQLAEWLYDKGKPWAVNLSSFEGVVMPKRQSVLGNIYPTFPLEVDANESVHTSLVFEWKLSDQAATLLPEGRVIFAHPDRLGTDVPFFIYMRKGRSIQLRVFYLLLAASKKDFVQHELRELVQKQLSACYSFDADWVLEELITEGNDFVLDIDLERGKFSQSVAQTPYLLDKSQLQHKEIVKYVDYYGIYRHFPLGKFSLALELCPLDKNRATL